MRQAKEPIRSFMDFDGLGREGSLRRKRDVQADAGSWTSEFSVSKFPKDSVGASTFFMKPLDSELCMAEIESLL